MSIKKEGYRMSINDLVLKVNDVLTGSVLIIALVGIGLLFTFKLGFIQIRGFKDGWNRTFGGLFSKKGDAGKDGMSSFQALATAINPIAYSKISTQPTNQAANSPIVAYV